MAAMRQDMFSAPTSSRAFGVWTVTAISAVIAGLSRLAGWLLSVTWIAGGVPAESMDLLILTTFGLEVLFILASFVTAGSLVVGLLRHRWVGRIGELVVGIGVALPWLWWAVSYRMVVLDDMSSHRVDPEMNINHYPQILPDVLGATAWGVAVDVAAIVLLIGGGVRMLRRPAATP